MFFQPLATREFRAVVEGDRVAALVIEFLPSLFDFLMHVAGILGLNLSDDREPGLAIDEHRQTVANMYNAKTR